MGNWQIKWISTSFRKDISEEKKRTQWFVNAILLCFNEYISSRFLQIWMDAQTLFVFKVGHSVYRRRNPTPDKTHHWRCWVESWSDQYPLSEFVNNVVFQLHETFKNPRQVVYKEPFSIEEDGFGNFRLLARVSFLNVVTDLHYDITLHDSRELYAFRTVRLDPKNYDEWIRFTQYGGIPIPKSANSYIIQQTVVEPIQSYGAKCNLPISHFYPDLTAAILDQTPIKFSSPIASSVPRSRPSRESRNQALANLGIPVTTNVSPAPLTNTTATTSSAVAYSGRYPPSLISSSSSFKHKKKLQLKHEAQLRLEKQSSSQSALPSSSSPSPSLPLPPTLQPMLSDSGSGSIISQNRGVPFVQQQQQQHERIVIRLLRSDIEKSKTKSKKKHKHKSRRLTDAAEDGQQQQQSSSNRMEWSSSRPPSGIPSYTQSSHTSLGGGEDHPIQPPSSFSASAIHSLPPDTAGVAVGSQKPSEQTETGTFPQMDSQQATLAWLSQLKGGPQPLVSPLPPPHTTFGPTSFSSPLSAQPPSQTQPQSQQLPQLPSVEKGQVSKESNCKDSKSHRPRKESKRTHSPGPSKQETVHKPASAMDICNCLQRTSNEDRNRNIMSSMGLSPDSTPPMSVEPVPQPIPEDGNVANKLPGAYFDNEELEKLFDRLCGLRHEESAVRLGEILTRYGKRTDSDCGVTVVELPDSYPMVISFDLRKLPLPCVLELAQVALDDENMSTSPS